MHDDIEEEEGLELPPPMKPIQDTSNGNQSKSDDNASTISTIRSMAAASVDDGASGDLAEIEKIVKEKMVSS
jgi:hypothetical protein